MGKQDVKQALLAMEDDDVCQRLAGGDFAAVEGLDLTPEEQALVRDAAAHRPEVSGFMFPNVQVNSGTYPYLKADGNEVAMESLEYMKAVRYSDMTSDGGGWTK